MLAADTLSKTRKWAAALIIVNLLRLGSAFISYFQVKYQFENPLVPQSVVVEIIRPYMIAGLLSTFFAIVAFGFFVYSKFTFTIITVVVGMVASFFLPAYL